jgi:hypothetical protein
MHPMLKDGQEKGDGKTIYRGLRNGNYVKYSCTWAQPAEMGIKKTIKPQRPVKGQERQM